LANLYLVLLAVLQVLALAQVVLRELQELLAQELPVLQLALYLLLQVL
jgi:hypothetical protein